ncbi:MAG: hypothetical protein NC429_09645 [Lachnospiraceae bacterium]|nr:hypothetical protein [Lachnospiraceae bacterium]
MKHSWIKTLIIGTVGICLTGCGNAIPEMTEQQQELVVEFAAGELLKFDQKHVTKLVPVEMIEEEESVPEEAPAEAPVSEEEKQEPAESEGIPADEATVIDQTEEAPKSVDEFLGLEGVSITYTGHEIADSYPTEMSDDVFFFMSATENNKLLVLKFQVENVSGVETVLDLAKGQTRYKIAVNGVEQNALTTMLLNDMAYYQGTLAAGESIELVVVGEVSSEQAGQIESLALTMKSVDDNATISLD